VSARDVRRFGPKIHQHLTGGERLVDVTPAVALGENWDEVVTGPITGESAVTAAGRVGSRVARAPGLLCVTDQRVLLFERRFGKVKRLWWEVRRDQVAEVDLGSPICTLRLIDGSSRAFGVARYWLLWVHGNRRFADLASALGVDR
jgi:hypothetical protein